MPEEHEVRISIVVDDLVNGDRVTVEVPRAQFTSGGAMPVYETGGLEELLQHPKIPRRKPEVSKYRFEFQPIADEETGTFLTITRSSALRDL